ncbi:class I poly(R)-hydroxyalkanoic acid synthase [Exilibacterium tricleocarpae]|uniref:Class I poly(R)-hydroxyalkanoic acid synthase n=1 Tax=Exilibacterium tricleocarpae TaxID=2591008 RepID=A0A545SMA9_9GAMM|nr:class I poly(R)-hydroxyalkanoic acid synthase [Exilibacterium tricleocarpae]TQV66140.1 class I poly(R)-hydroxyalkanoic acid synthase [Exilibacterium tricleocarpae]
MDSSEQIALMQHLDKVASVFGEAAGDLLQRLLSGQRVESNSLLDSERMIALLAQGAKVEPASLLQQQMQFMEKQLNLWQCTIKAMMGGDLESVIDEPRGDNRFRAPEWRENPFFSYIKQAYLLNADFMQQVVDGIEYEDEKTADQIKFFTRQYVNSLSPSNYILTNPEVCKEILETKGDSLAKGLDNFIKDLESSPLEGLKINQVDMDAFKVGVDLAVTPGKVIFENELMQLIQYAPATDKVYQTPLLIVPPFINKYYILDLDRKKSWIRWLVDQGFTVFLVSWVNPDATLAQKTFDDYVLEGVVAALDTVEQITGRPQVNAVGYCVGGTLLGVSQAYLRARGDDRIQALTLLTTLFDFSEPGEVGNYISEHSLPLIKQYTENKGYFDGRLLALSFSLLRENNLFWTYFVDNYLKGKDSVPFDILYWNGDSTNIPQNAYLYYLENMYVNNRLIEPGGISVAGVPIDLGLIDTPAYSLATAADHIVLWPAAYRSSRHLRGPVRFVLAGSGHVAGVVNPAPGGKYPHWVNEVLPETAQQWRQDAEQREGSWWLDWLDWMAQYRGALVDAKPVGSKRFPALEDAPGRYVKVRLETAAAA